MSRSRTSRAKRKAGAEREGEGEGEVEEGEVEIVGSNAGLCMGGNEPVMRGNDGRGSQINSQKKHRSIAAASSAAKGKSRAGRRHRPYAASSKHFICTEV